MDQLGLILDDCIGGGIIDRGERLRFLHFKKLFSGNEAEVFSLRAHYGGVEESIHFTSRETISKVTTDSQERDENGIGFVNDFRPNVPGNLKKSGGYPTGDILGIEKRLFSPNLKEVYEDDGKTIIGYLSRMPVGGFIQLNNRETYFIGLLSFYLLVVPTILFDRDGRLHDCINDLKKKVKDILGADLPSYIPREEKMSRPILQRIKESFMMP